MQTASVRWIGEQKFAGTSPSGHTVPFDSDRESNKAPGPMEMVLMALGACTATDMVIILEKEAAEAAGTGSALLRGTCHRATHRVD